MRTATRTSTPSPQGADQSPVSDELTLRDLLGTRHEREFDERVPLPPAARARINLGEAWRCEQLSKHVEFRASQAEGRLLSRVAAAAAWFREEYEPIADALEELGIGGPGTETTRFLRVVLLRDLLLSTGGWSDALLERLLDAIRGSRTARATRSCSASFGRCAEAPRW